MTTRGLAGLLSSIVAYTPFRQRLRHVLGQAGTKVQRLPGNRVHQRQPPGMQGLPLHTRCGAAAIQRVRHQGVANGRHMHPDLVGAAGLEVHLDEARRGLEDVAAGRTRDAREVLAARRQARSRA